MHGDSASQPSARSSHFRPSETIPATGLVFEAVVTAALAAEKTGLARADRRASPVFSAACDGTAHPDRTGDLQSHNLAEDE
jgi:hypothetical protein